MSLEARNCSARPQQIDEDVPMNFFSVLSHVVNCIVTLSFTEASYSSSCSNLAFEIINSLGVLDMLFNKKNVEVDSP